MSPLTCVAILMYAFGVLAHQPGNPNLWECHCWDYTVNEAFKRLSPRPTPRPTVSPLPDDWPDFLKPSFWEQKPWRNTP
jgi:hypothetical protein